MFKISPINDIETQIKYAYETGSTYKKGYFAYSMIDSETGELMGFSQFEINANGGLIADLRPRISYTDDEAMFILGRATMNFIDLCGSHICFALNDSSDPKLLHAIGFRDFENGILRCDMTGMFDGKCSGNH